MATQKLFRTDIYALGAILFEMLYNTTPVQGENVLDILKKTLVGELTIPQVEVQAPLKAVALRALSVKRRKDTKVLQISKRK